METTTLSSKYQLVVPKAVRDALNLRPGQRFVCRVGDGTIELVPCEQPSELRGILAGADTDIDDIRERDPRV